MSDAIETCELCASLLEQGANGAEPREWLDDEHPGVRGCAALAPALADDWKAWQVLEHLCGAPRAFDQALGYGIEPASPALRHFAGPPHWALIEAACARAATRRDPASGVRMALQRAFRTAPRPDVSPYLRGAFPDGWPEVGDETSLQRVFAGYVAGRHALWQADDGTRMRTLEALALPTDRAAWQELANRPRDGTGNFSAADIFVVSDQLAVRGRPAIYLGEGVDKDHPGLLPRIFDRLSDAYEQAVTNGEMDGYRLTIESDSRVTVSVDGAAFSVEHPRRSGSSEFTYMFTATHLSHSGRTDSMVYLNIASAFCHTVQAHTWYGGQGYAQDFVDMIAMGPIRSTGPAIGTGYRAVLEFDIDWLPPGSAVPRGLDRPGVTDLRGPA